ncbi:hypothetical protein QMZ92_05910 [Streptomyces sp. HNM0645]|nr:hypothetical protein [Streptomyces sp. HNM0645]MDI9883941.1 hypothetical protein [Streptomyces sp. HNM0645]
MLGNDDDSDKGVPDPGPADRILSHRLFCGQPNVRLDRSALL